MELNIIRLLDEYKEGKSIVEDMHGNVSLGEEFKKVYKQRCEVLGIIPSIDFEIYKNTSGFNNTVCYSLLKDLTRFSILYEEGNFICQIGTVII